MLGARGLSLASSVGPPVLLPGALGASKPGGLAAPAKRAGAASISDPKSWDAQKIPWFFPRDTRLSELGLRGPIPERAGSGITPPSPRSPETPLCHGLIQPRLGAGSALEPRPADAGSTWEVSSSAGMLEGRATEAAAWKQQAEGSGEAQGLSWGQIPNANLPRGLRLHRSLQNPSHPALTIGGNNPKLGAEEDPGARLRQDPIL